MRRHVPAHRRECGRRRRSPAAKRAGQKWRDNSKQTAQTPSGSGVGGRYEERGSGSMNVDLNGRWIARWDEEQAVKRGGRDRVRARGQGPDADCPTERRRAEMEDKKKGCRPRPN